jgi:hypothetical protein
MLHVVALLSIAASCRANAADATVIVLDTSAGRDSLEVVALPLDPASLRSPKAGLDSLAVPSTAADSIAALDTRFQQARTALNAEAGALQPGDRHSAEYSQRFDAWRRRAIAADSLRALRDKLRARSRRSPLLSAKGESTLRATLLSAASTDGRAAIVRRLTLGDSVSLDLSRGDWWVGVADAGGVPSNWRRATGRRLVLRP